MRRTRRLARKHKCDISVIYQPEYLTEGDQSDVSVEISLMLKLILEKWFGCVCGLDLVKAGSFVKFSAQCELPCGSITERNLARRNV